MKKESNVKLDLLPHNREAYEKVMKTFESKRKAAVIHCTGSGKSFIGGAVASHFTNVLIVAPNEYVISQASKAAQHAECRTYCWISQQEAMPTGYDLIWFDEFHRMGAETWATGCQRLIDANPDAKILGSTATSERSLEKRDMADEWFEDAVVSRLSLSDAWVRHILRVPVYVTGVISMDDVKNDYVMKIHNAKRLSEADKRKASVLLSQTILNWENSYGVPRILRKYIDENVERIVVFSQSVSRLEESLDTLPRWFSEAGIKIAGIYHAHSKMGVEAKRQLAAFESDDREGVKILLSVDMLNEGIHINRVDAVILFRATISKNIYMQQIGRCFAVGQGHQPIILDLADNMASACGYDGIYIAKERFENEGQLWKDDSGYACIDRFQIIDTLRETRDILEHLGRITAFQRPWEEIEEYIRKFHKENGRLPGRKDDPSVYAYMKMHRQPYYINKYPERIAFLQSMGWKIAVPHNEYNYERAVSEIRDLHDKGVPILHSNKAVRYLKYLLKTGKADDRQIEEIHSLGIEIKNLNEAWMSRYRKVKAVYDETGSLDSLKKEERAWVYLQWENKHLTDEQHKLLEDMGAFSLKKARASRTTRQCISDLKEYVEKNGGYFPTCTEHKSLYAFWHNAYKRNPSIWKAINEAGMDESNIRPPKKSYMDIVKEFHDANGRLPVEGEEAYEALEKTTRSMSLKERTYIRNLGYKTKLESSFEETFGEFKEWVTSHGYLPTERKSDRKQTKLSKWMYNILRGDTSYRTILKEFTDQYNYAPDYRKYHVDEFRRDFQELREYVESTGNLPERGTKLMDVLKKALHGRTMKEECRRLFSRFGYGETSGWIAATLSMQKLRAFYKEHGRLPNTSKEERYYYKIPLYCKDWREAGIHENYVKEIIGMGFNMGTSRKQRSYLEWKNRIVGYLESHDGMKPSWKERKLAHDFNNFRRLHPEEYAEILSKYGK